MNNENDERNLSEETIGDDFLIRIANYNTNLPRIESRIRNNMWRNRKICDHEEEIQSKFVEKVMTKLNQNERFKQRKKYQWSLEDEIFKHCYRYEFMFGLIVTIA